MVKNPPTVQETQVRSLGWEDPLEKEMATLSTILAWRISMDRGAGRGTVHGFAVGHDWATKHRYRASQVALVVKSPPASAGNVRHGFNPWVSKNPWRRRGDPLQYSCLENPMDRGAWWATVHRVAKSQTRLKGLDMHTDTPRTPCGRPWPWTTMIIIPRASRDHFLQTLVARRVVLYSQASADQTSGFFCLYNSFKAWVGFWPIHFWSVSHTSR